MQRKNHRLTSSEMEAIHCALLYIGREYRCNITAEDLSQEVNLCKEKLQAGLKKKTSLTLHRYILKVRIDKATELLSSTDVPLKSIAILTGFKDDSYFCKVFRRQMHTSPMAFRIQNLPVIRAALSAPPTPIAVAV